MPEIRFDMDSDDLSILDGYVSASGSSRTEVIKELVRKWSADKLHESIVICRLARVNPLEPELHRSAVSRPSEKWSKS